MRQIPACFFSRAFFRIVFFVGVALLSWAFLGAARPAVAAAMAPVILDADTRVLAVGQAMALLEDVGGTLTFEDVRTRADWIPSRSQEPNFGFTRSAWWARFRVDVTAPADMAFYLLVDDAILNRLDVYFVETDDRVQHSRGGGWVPVDAREQPYRSHAFLIPGTGARSIEVYLRVASHLAVVMPVKIIESHAFTTANTVNTWMQAVYFGFMIAMLIFNAVVGLRMRQSLNLLYCGFALSLILISLSFSGLGRQFFWPAPSWVDNIVFSVACASAAVFGTLFNEKFLFDQRRDNQRFRHFTRRTVFGLSGISVGCSFNQWMEAGIILAAVSSVVAALNFFINCLVAMRLRIPKARLLLIAWSGVLIGVIVFVGRGFGVFPSNTFTTHALQISSLFECFLLLVAIIEKARHLRDALEEANVAARKSLEQEVQARTAALRRAQQQWIDNEQRHAMMVFAAGAAHEINNPANFISAGAQQAVADVSRLQDTLMALLDDDADPLIVQDMQNHFADCQGNYQSILAHTQRMTDVVAELRKLYPEVSSRGGRMGSLDVPQ